MSRRHLQWMVGLIACVLIPVLIFDSSAYRSAKRYLDENPEIKSEFGDIKCSIPYVAKIKNSRAQFTFYVFGAKRDSSLRIRVDQDEQGRWSASRADQSVLPL